MDRLQLLTYTSEAALDKSPSRVIYQLLKKKKKKSLPSLLQGEEPHKNAPWHSPTTKTRPCRRAWLQLKGRLAPSSPGKHPNRALLVSLAEPRGKPQARARSPSLPGSFLHIPTPRHVLCLAFHATRSNSYLLSTHCLHRIVARGTAGRNGPTPEKPIG